jgi:hypothetical protein
MEVELLPVERQLVVLEQQDKETLVVLVFNKVKLVLVVVVVEKEQLVEMHQMVI